MQSKQSNRCQILYWIQMSVSVLGLLLVLGNAKFISGDTLATEVQSLILSPQEEPVGKVAVVEKQNQIVFLLSDLASGLSQPTATIWTRADKSDARTITEFQQDESGNYSSVLSRDSFSTESSHIYVEVSLQADTGRHTFDLYEFDWIVEQEEAASSVVNSETESSASSFRSVVPSSPSGKLTITNVNPQSGTFDVVVSDVVGSSAIQQVQVPVWSETGGQDDIIWYSAVGQADGTYRLTVDKSRHKNSTGLYHVHLYYRYTDGKPEGINGTSTELVSVKSSGQIQIANVNAQSGTFDVVVSDVVGSSAIQQVQVPVWSETGGQDDIIWYSAVGQADGTYRLTVDKSRHKNSTGLYHVHLYYRYTDGKPEGINGTSTELASVKSSGQIQIVNVNAQSGTFDVVVSDVVGSSAIQQVQVPVWSETGGQDDIIWYSAVRQADGTYRLTVDKSRHKNSTGLYHVHLYYRYTDGKLEGINGTSTELAKAKVAATMTVENQNVQNGEFDVVIRDVIGPTNLTTVLVPIWSDMGGQDDIVWYTAIRQSDGSYSVHIQSKNHRYSTGLYHIHLYFKDSANQLLAVGATSTQVEITDRTPRATLRIQNYNPSQASFEIVVTDVFAPTGIDKVQVPVWSEVGGQDDIIWYTATRQSDGSYKVLVQAGNHGYSNGLYHAHLYLRLPNGQPIGVGMSQITINTDQIVPTATTSYLGTGLYSVSLRPIRTSGTVKIAVWSDTNGQDDISWYTASRKDTWTFEGRFNAQNHRHAGLYHIHVYEEVNGGIKGLLATTVHVGKSDFSAPYYSQLDGRWSGLRYGMSSFGATGCVPATVAMIASGIKGQTITPVDVGNYLYHHTLEFNRGFLGTSSRGVVFAARNWGLRTKTLQSVSAVATALHQGYYVAAAVGPSKFIVSGGHEIVLKGYRNGQTYVLDPYNPRNNGWYSIEYLWNIQSQDPIDRTEGHPFIQITD